MKTKVLWLLILISGRAISQIGINNAVPSATLDIISKGNTSATKALEVNNSSATELFTILDNGNVGIGVNNPTQKLDITGNVSLLPQGGVASALNFYENTTNGTNLISIKAPSNITSNRTITLPQNQPVSGYVLITDASGNTSWGTSTPSSTTLASIAFTGAPTAANMAINPVAGSTTDLRFFQKFNTPITNTNGLFALSAPNVYTYTAPQPGNYMIAAYIVPNANPGTNTSNFYYPVNLEVRKGCAGDPNGGTIIMDNSTIRYATPGVTSLRYSVAVTGMVSLNTGETLDLVVYLNGAQASATATSGVSFPNSFTYAGVADYKAFFSVTAL